MPDETNQPPQNPLTPDEAAAALAVATRITEVQIPRNKQKQPEVPPNE